MKKYFLRLFALSLALLALAGCGQIGSAPPFGLGDNKAANPDDSKPDAAEPPAPSFSPGADEKRFAQASGSSMLKWDNLLVYTDRQTGLYLFDLEAGEGRALSDADINVMAFDGEYVFYSPSYYTEREFYRIDTAGNTEKLLDSAVLQFLLRGDKIYFTRQEGIDEINQTPQGDLCVMNKDGSGLEVVIPKVKNYFKIVGDTIFYTDWDSRAIYRAGIDGTGKEKLADGRTLITMANENYVYYVDYNDNEAHYQLNIKSKEKTKLGLFGNALQVGEEYFVRTRPLIGATNDTVSYTFVVLRMDPVTGEAEQVATTPTAVDFMKHFRDGWVYIGWTDKPYRAGENEAIEYLPDAYNDGFYIDAYCFAPVFSADSGLDGILCLNLDDGHEVTLHLKP